MRFLYAVLCVLLYVCQSEEQLTALAEVSVDGPARLSPRAVVADQPLVAHILRQLADVKDGPQTMPDKREKAPDVVGTWTKTTTAACADKYPATLTFSTGTYRGTRGPGQGMVWWDAGIYRLEEPGKLVVGTATDELVTYQIVLQADHFDVTDSDGCRVTYRRETRTP